MSQQDSVPRVSSNEMTARLGQQFPISPRFFHNTCLHRGTPHQNHHQNLNHGHASTSTSTSTSTISGDDGNVTMMPPSSSSSPSSPSSLSVEKDQLFMYVFGGRNSIDGHYSDVYRLELGIETKRIVSVECLFDSRSLSSSDNDKWNTVPKPRRSASMVYHPERHSLVIYGGRDRSALFGAFSEVHEFKLEERQWYVYKNSARRGHRHAIWQRSSIDGRNDGRNDGDGDDGDDGLGPGPLRNHTALLINNNSEMLIFGGYNVTYGVNPTSTMYKFSFDTLKWSRVRFGMADGSESLLMLGQHTAVLWRVPCNVLRTECDIRGDEIVVGDRVYYEERMVVYGGNKTVRAEADNHHVWEFRLNENLWYKVVPDERFEQPISRYAHAACVHGDHMFVLAGFQGENDMNDFWSINLKSRKWTKHDYQEGGFIFGHSLNIWNDLYTPLDDHYFAYRDLGRYKGCESAEMTWFGGSDEDSNSLNLLTYLRVELPKDSVMSHVRAHIRAKQKREYHSLLYAKEMKSLMLSGSPKSQGDILVNGVFRCHSYILKMLDNRLLDTSNRPSPSPQVSITIPNMENDVLKNILLYVYSGVLDVSAQNDYVMLIKIAHEAVDSRLELMDLAQECINCFEAILSCKLMTPALELLTSMINEERNFNKYPIAKIMFNKVLRFARDHDLKTGGYMSYNLSDDTSLQVPNVHYDRNRYLLSLIDSAAERREQAVSIDPSASGQFITLLVKSGSNARVNMIADYAILTHRCPYFHCMFSHDFQEAVSGEINFYDLPESIIEEQVMKYLLMWIYCADIDLLISRIESQYGQQHNEREQFIQQLATSANLLMLNDLVSLLYHYESTT